MIKVSETRSALRRMTLLKCSADAGASGDGHTESEFLSALEQIAARQPLTPEGLYAQNLANGIRYDKGSRLTRSDLRRRKLHASLGAGIGAIGGGLVGQALVGTYGGAHRDTVLSRIGGALAGAIAGGAGGAGLGWLNARIGEGTLRHYRGLYAMNSRR